MSYTSDPPTKTPCERLLPSSLDEVEGETGRAFTETGQAEVEIPKEKDAKFTASSRDGEICGTKVGGVPEHGAKLVLC